MEQSQKSRRKVKPKPDTPGRYYIDYPYFETYFRQKWAGKNPTLTLIDRCLESDLEVEKLLLFVHSQLNHDLDYLSRMPAPTFFQLLSEADKVQRAKEKQARN